MRLEVERYEDNENKSYETLKEMAVTLRGADGDWGHVIIKESTIY